MINQEEELNYNISNFIRSIDTDKRNKNCLQFDLNKSNTLQLLNKN